MKLSCRLVVTGAVALALASSAFGQTYTQLAELTGTQSGDGFGDSIAISGNTMVVGVPLASDVCENCGAAYVYAMVNGDWANLVQVATLRQSSGQTMLGGFGYPVAISQGTIVVGGYDAQTEQSAAYVYVNPSGNVAQTAELTTSDTDGGINSIAIDGGTIVFGIADFHGAPYAAAFVYVEPQTGWADMTQTAELVSKDLDGGDFGVSVAVSGRNIAVGAPAVKIGSVRQGAAYLFEEPGAGWRGIWSPTVKFEASNGTRNAGFGTSVSVSGDTVAVGAPDEAVGSFDNEGAIYIFTRPSSGWSRTMTEIAELTGAKAGSLLGYSVALSGKTLLAGAPYEDIGAGLADVFREPSDGWQGSQAILISASDGSEGNYFGRCVSIDGGVLAASAPAWPNGIPLEADGAVYVFGKNQ